MQYVNEIKVSPYAVSLFFLSIAATRCSGRDFPLHRAAYQGPSSEILRLIFQQGLSLSELDDANWAPLHHAAWAGNVATVETLLNPVPFFTQLRVEEEEGEEEEVFKRDHAGGKVTARNEAFVTNEGGKVVGSAKWIARGGKTSASLRQRDFAGSRFKDVRASLPRMHPHSASNTDQKHFENNINIAGNNNRSVINNNNVPSQSERAPHAHPPASFPDHFAASIDSMRRQRLYPGVTGCSPNIKNGNKATPLHLAALNGHEGVVQLLVDHPKIHLRWASLSILRLLLLDAFSFLIFSTSSFPLLTCWSFRLLPLPPPPPPPLSSCYHSSAFIFS